jgi:CRP-like cAMP-binding protein/Na+/melibiose symporter-like transporter
VVFLLDTTDSAAWVAAAAAARTLAYVVSGPIGGALADRLDRRRLIIVLDVARLVLMIAGAAAIWGAAAPWVAVAIAMANSVFTAGHRPAVIAATPELVPEDDLAAANAAEGVVVSLGFFVGPAIGAGIVALTDTATAFVVNGVLFALATLLAVGLPTLGGSRHADSRSSVLGDEGSGVAPQSQGGFVATVLDDVAEGGRIVWRSAPLLALTMLVSAYLFQYGMEGVAHPFVATDLLGLGNNGVGVLMAAAGAGALVVAPFMPRIGARGNAGSVMIWCALVIAGTMLALAFTSSPVVAAVLLGIEGVCTVVLEVLSLTMLQRVCPDGAVARVFGLQDSLTAVTQVLGAAATPLLIKAIDLEGALVVGALVFALVAVLCRPVLTRSSEQYSTERLRLAPQVQRLRELGIFGDASQAALERIARSMRAVSFAAGEKVFQEGDHPDVLYIVADGSFSVSKAAEGVVGELAPGAWFGEIGLLRGIPRTATVSAIGAARAEVIPGRVFVDALVTFDLMPDPLRRTMASRLRPAPSDPPMFDPPSS